MKYTEARQGRVFVIRLEDGDVIHEKIEQFAREKGIAAAALVIVGGADKGSALVVGPWKGRSRPVVPMELLMGDVHEITGTGTIFPDMRGAPSLHMHIACGRKDKTITGCIRKGVKTWHVLEVILFELAGVNATRVKDAATGFELLEPGRTAPACRKTKKKGAKTA